MIWYFECPIQYFSAAFVVLIKISESYRPKIPSEYCQSSNPNESLKLVLMQGGIIKSSFSNISPTLVILGFEVDKPSKIVIKTLSATKYIEFNIQILRHQETNDSIM